MRLAGSKTQVLVLSQKHQDARDCTIKVDGTPVAGTRHLRLLGVTFDRQLHFGEHCARLRRKTKPRVAQLRKLTARSWGLREPQLRTVANGYARGALEYAARWSTRQRRGSRRRRSRMWSSSRGRCVPRHVS